MLMISTADDVANKAAAFDAEQARVAADAEAARVAAAAEASRLTGPSRGIRGAGRNGSEGEADHRQVDHEIGNQYEDARTGSRFCGRTGWC